MQGGKRRAHCLILPFPEGAVIDRCRTFASTLMHIAVWKPGIGAWQN
ncbi:Hypothetical protein OINT_1001401 [Brucella intermedia LMG 3301]|uniref:Uncharacterized protein n=1 Tax=Brucella intermedia LMG 3301 TaxID=641118 RepID=C4WKG3_9HYPH|nr:Hypothetical protein OINT_1001401 [Brucella intermedia LMG 3301]